MMKSGKQAQDEGVECRSFLVVCALTVALTDAANQGQNCVANRQIIASIDTELESAGTIRLAREFGARAAVAARR